MCQYIVMATTHQFGGDWTEEKLERIRKYLEAYTKIFTVNKGAAYYITYYVDAFAGTGYRDVKIEKDAVKESLYVNEMDIEALESDAMSLQKGSARVALEIPSPFNHYVFIEKKSDYIEALNQLKHDFPERNIEILRGEANKVLQDWLKKVNWKSSRAVVFLDPYGMDVDWQTIEAIAATKAIDLWILFPLAQAVNRLLTKANLPNDSWSQKLTRFFGTDSWREAFYQKKSIDTPLFGEFETDYKKDADFDDISQFFVQRLQTVFDKVAPNPLPLFNSKGSPLFLLCFAASNPKGSGTAVKIAGEILGKTRT
jgi:three-Cys-motif partner protein